MREGDDNVTLANADTLVIACAPSTGFSPPVGFYLACVRTARAVLGVRRVALVFADRSNPTVTALEMALQARGIPVVSRRIEPAEPLDAVHMVAAGLTAPPPRLRSLFGFRAIAPGPDRGDGREIRLFVGDDTSPGYPRPADWTGSSDQRIAMLTYPENDIAITEAPAVSVPPSHDDGTAEAILLADPDGCARLAAIYGRLYPGDPLLPVLVPLLAAIRDPSAPMPGLPAASLADARIGQNIARVRAVLGGSTPRRMIDIDQSDDFLATSGEATDRSLLWRVNLLAMRQIRPTRKVAVMATMRDAGINILEWVAHHQAIGAEGIFVYASDNSDGSDELLSCLASHGLITLVRQTSALGTHVQRKSLQHAVHALPELRDFEWVLFVDADQLAMPAEQYDHSITRLIARAEQFGKVGAVVLPWQWRLWPHRFDRQPGMRLARFAHAEPHALFQPLVRLADMVGMHGARAPDLEAGRRIVASDFTDIAPDQLREGGGISSQGGWIEHFWGRSFVEFAIHRQRAVDDVDCAASLFTTLNRAMTLANLRPVASIVIARTRARMERMLDEPDIAAAVADVEAAFSRRATAIAADPAISAAFAGLSDPNPAAPWSPDDVGRCDVILGGPDGPARLASAFARHFADAPPHGIISGLLMAIRDPAAPLPPVETSDPNAPFWRDVIARSRAQRLGDGGRRVIHLGIDHDFIAQHHAPTGWGLWQWLGVLALRQIQPSHTVAAMLSTRNEGINLLEWVAHYQAIGVDHIFVYTNGNDDGSDDLLTALADQGIITLVLQTCGPGIWAQRRAMQHALLMLPELRRYSWVLFPDADEYTIPDARYDHRIAPLLAAADALPTRPGAMLLPWRMRLWPHRFDRPPGMTLANYPHAVVHELFKSAVRPAVATSMIEIHFPFLDPGVPLVDSGLAEVPAGSPWSKIPKSDAGGRIEHVWARSFTDFIIKRQRGFTGGFRHFDLFHKFNLAMTPENLRPIEPVVIARVRDQLAALGAIPDIAAAAARVEAIYAARAAEIAADPELRALFDAQPNPNGEDAG